MYRLVLMVLALAWFGVCAPRASAQEHAADLGARLKAAADVDAALKQIPGREAALVEDQIRICEVPAPPFKEEARGEVLKRPVRAARPAERAHRHGRQRARRAARAQRRGRIVVMAAHLDTVFPEGTDVKVKREGAVLDGPGIGDDCRGLAVLVGDRPRCCRRRRSQTPGTITFVANVGEEGLGDLRGMKELFGGR